MRFEALSPQELGAQLDDAGCPADMRDHYVNVWRQLHEQPGPDGRPLSFRKRRDALVRLALTVRAVGVAMTSGCLERSRRPEPAAGAAAVVAWVDATAAVLWRAAGERQPAAGRFEVRETETAVHVTVRLNDGRDVSASLPLGREVREQYARTVRFMDDALDVLEPR